jgi:hypothetical protein
MDKAIAIGEIRIHNAVKLKIVKIQRRRFRNQVLVRWTVLNQEPEERWVREGEIMNTQIDVDIKPEI